MTGSRSIWLPFLWTLKFKGTIKLVHTFLIHSRTIFIFECPSIQFTLLIMFWYFLFNIYSCDVKRVPVLSFYLFVLPPKYHFPFYISKDLTNIQRIFMWTLMLQESKRTVLISINIVNIFCKLHNFYTFNKIKSLVNHGQQNWPCAETW